MQATPTSLPERPVSVPRIMMLALLQKVRPKTPTFNSQHRDTYDAAGSSSPPPPLIRLRTAPPSTTNLEQQPSSVPAHPVMTGSTDIELSDVSSERTTRGRGLHENMLLPSCHVRTHRSPIIRTNALTTQLEMFNRDIINNNTGARQRCH